MNAYAKFLCAALRIKKALWIFRELITTTTTARTTNGESSVLGPAFRVQKSWLLAWCVYCYRCISADDALLFITPPPVGGRGLVFGRFLSLFLCRVSNITRTAGPISRKFSGKEWSDHGTTWLNFESVRVNGYAGQRSICFLSPVIAQRTGVNKSVSFARWQRGRGLLCLAPQLVNLRLHS